MKFFFIPLLYIFISGAIFPGALVEAEKMTNCCCSAVICTKEENINF